MITAIICTSIFDPEFIDKYAKHFYDCNLSEDEYEFIIVEDEKTPTEKYERTLRQYGDNFKLFTKEIQYSYFKEIPDDLLNFIAPKNSIRRRNLGLLYAICTGVDNFIVLDDDNLPCEGSKLFSGHVDALANKNPRFVVSSKNRVVNPCRILHRDATMDQSQVMYQRGYPLDKCFTDSFDILRIIDANVSLNLGLWTETPDVDAALHLHYACKISKPTAISFVLEHGNYMPLNTQNISYVDWVAPVFYNFHTPVISGFNQSRYDDIWNGVVVSKILNHVGASIGFGAPFSMHKRNKHDYVSDFTHEYFGSILNCKFWDTVINADLSTKNPMECFKELSEAIPKGFKDYDDLVRREILKLSDSMYAWVKVVDRICAV